MKHFSPSIVRVAVFALFTLAAGSLHAENLLAAFDQANKLYEQGKYA